MGVGFGVSRRAWLAVAVIVIFAPLMILPILPLHGAGFLSLAVRSLTAVVACGVIAYQATKVSGRLRSARFLIAGALLAAGTGGLLQLPSALTGGPPPLSADLIYALFLPLALAGLLTYPVDSPHLNALWRSVLDGLLAATALWFVVSALLLAPAHVGESGDLHQRFNALLYPAADVLLIGIISAALMRATRASRRELLFIGGGLVLVAISDLTWAVITVNGRYNPGAWVPVVQQTGLLLIVFATSNYWKSARPRPRVDRVAQSRLADKVLPSLPIVPVVLAVAVAATFAIEQKELSSSEFVVGMAVLILLLLQQWVGNRDRSSLARKIAEREQLFSSMVTGSSDLISLQDAAGNVLYASPALARILGVDESEILGEGLRRFVDPDDADVMAAALSDVGEEPGSTKTVMNRLHVEDGSFRWMQTIMHNLLDDPNVEGIVCNTRDVHEQHLLRERLAFDAYHDALTGLGNLAQARMIFAEHCLRPGVPPTIVVLADLDGFKTLNDTFGHEFGDGLLVAIGRRLRTVVADEDAVCRIGGDEFVMIFDADDDKFRSVANVLNALRRPLLVDGTTVTLEASIGVAQSIDAKTPDDLLRNADLAMYAAKAAGRNQIVWYQEWMFESTSKRLHMQEGLRRALNEGLFELNYQPIVKLPHGEAVGAEVLLRWSDPKEGFIPPEEFIPIAEGSGIIADIDSWVLNEACRQLAAWNAVGTYCPQLSINVSRRQLTGALPSLVARTLRTHRVSPRQLCIEVTESAVVPDADSASDVLSELRAMGIVIALDDFGTGQSSLSQLARLPLDKVKIDKSFVTTSSNDPEALRFLRSIVGVCLTLGLPIVAEGIEDQKAVANLAAMGCHLGQGYYFARPMPPADFAAMLSSRIPFPQPARRLEIDS